jgi:hypothetical protein
MFENAAIATVAAAEQGNPGIHLIANDQPLAVREWLPAFAQWLNAPPPPQISVEDALKASGAAAVWLDIPGAGAGHRLSLLLFSFSTSVQTRPDRRADHCRNHSDRDEWRNMNPSINDHFNAGEA